MVKIAIVMCNEMHMDIEHSNLLITSILQNGSYEIVSDYTVADVIIVQTCAFGEKKRYSVRVIADIKVNARIGALVVVTGCMLETDYGELQVIPGLYLKKFDELIDFFKKSGNMESFSELQLIQQNCVIISEGCRKNCSYCVYPLICKGYKSKPVEDILLEVEKLYETETTIYLTGAQETSDYGIDLYGKSCFPDLLQKICTIFPDCNYIVGWFHPAGLTNKMIEVIAKNKNIGGIMLHVQHVSNKILKKMNRPPFEFTDAKIRKLKEVRPDLEISTEVIVGFPGETQQEDDDLIEYLKEGMFDNIGVADYEQVPNTIAAKEPQIPVKIRKERLKKVMDAVEECIAYPASSDTLSVIGEYVDSYAFFESLPRNIFNDRQKYQYIAGVDTLEKLNLEFEMHEILRYIIQSRSQFDFDKNGKYLREKYTSDMRKWAYTILEEGDFKKGTKKKAKMLLLGNS